MATASIADIYDAIKHTKGEYCSICFQPSSERKLVAPVFLIQLPRYHKMSAVEKERVKVCYICEGMAASAIRFQHAVNVASAVEAILACMTDALRDALVGPSKLVTRETTTINRVREVEANMRKTKIPQLACSHVLLVGSDTPAAQTSCGTNTGTSPVGTRLTRPVSTRPGDNRLARARIVGASPNGTRPEFNNAPIIVADDPPLAQGDNMKGMGVQVTSAPGQLQLQLHERATGTIMLHPIVIGSNGKMYVPSLKVEVLNNEILKSVSDLDLFQYANVPMPPKKPVERKIIPKNVAPSKPENTTMIGNYYDFIKQQSKEKQIILNGRDELENAVDSILNKKARLEIKEPKRDQNGRVEEINESVGSVMKPEKTYAVQSAPKPVLRMDKVLDWEDKIPMDVISFMDATDPNPNERIMQPNLPSPPVMGVISDVRTIDDNEDSVEYINVGSPTYKYVEINSNNDDVVNTVNIVNSVNNDEEIDNDVLLVENIECIDLC